LFLAEAIWRSRFPQHHFELRLAILAVLGIFAREGRTHTITAIPWHWNPLAGKTACAYTLLGWWPPTGGVGKPHRQRIEETMKI